jgi:tetrahydromethanopterin S-methyltransferase subunit G
LDDLDTQHTIPPAAQINPPEKKGNLLKRHPFLTAVIFLALLFGGYKLMQSVGPAEMTPAPTSKTAQTKMTHIPATGGVEIRQIDERLDTIEQSMNVLNDQLTQLQGAHTRIEQMEQMVTKIAEEERGLSAILLRLEALNKQVTALTSLDQRLNALEAQVGVIASEVELHITVAEQTQRAANLSRQAMQAKSMIPVPMVVQAAIPGRAWLLSETGELLTVARGDDVPGYGRVMNIDPVAGTVTMSSETVFREKE